VTARQVRHGNQDDLNHAVAAARWSTSGDAGQRVLSRKRPQLSPLVAAALALHGLSLPEPRRRGWVISLCAGPTNSRGLALLRSVDVGATSAAAQRSDRECS